MPCIIDQALVCTDHDMKFASPSQIDSSMYLAMEEDLAGQAPRVAEHG